MDRWIGSQSVVRLSQMLLLLKSIVSRKLGKVGCDVFLSLYPFPRGGVSFHTRGGDVEIASWSEAEVMEIRASLGGGKRLERPTSWD